MMNKKIKNIFLFALTFIACVCVSLFLMTTPVERRAYAEEVTSVTVNETTVSNTDFLVSVAVRAETDAYGNGVRFTISLPEEKFNALLEADTEDANYGNIKSGVKTGVLLTSDAKATAIGGLTLANAYNDYGTGSAALKTGIYDYALNAKWHRTTLTVNEVEGNYYSAYVTIYNVPNAGLDVDLKVAPYISYGGNVAIKTAASAASMRGVVKSHVDANPGDYDAFADPYFNCSVNYYDTDGTFIDSEVVIYGESPANTPTETLNGYSTTGTRAGYTFDWYKNNTSAYALGAVTSNLNLYAHYTMGEVTDLSSSVSFDFDKYVYDNTPASVPTVQSLASALGTVTEVCDADNVGENIIDENGKLDLSVYNWNNGSSNLGERKLIVTTDDGANTKVSAVIATKVINSVSDWNSLDSIASTTDSRENYWGGYYVLGSDIEANGSSLNRIAQHNSGDDGKGFVGVIDGRGHVINNFTIGYWGWGMIGGIGSGSVIKNLSLTNVAHPGYTALLGIKGASVNISNIYVHYKSVTYPGTGDATGLFLGTIWDGAVDNVVIDITNANNNFNGSDNADAFVFNSKLSYFHNCYVIGSDYIKLSYSDGSTTTGRYGMFYDMKVANNDLSSFNSDFWVKLSNIPYAKNAISKIGKPLFSDLGKGAQFYEAPQSKGLLKNSYTKVHRMNAGSSAVKYNSSAFILSKADLNTLKALGKTTVKVAVALDNTQAVDLVVTANFGTYANVTVPGANAWDYKSYVIEIPLQDIIDDYDTITVSGYSFFTVTGASSMFSLSDMMIV